MKKWIPTVVALVLIVACLRLSLWQLDRAEEKAGLVADWERAGEVEIGAVTPDTARFSRVSGSGRFDPDRQLLLDNQIRNTLPGVHVLTPFRSDREDTLYLVNRGWWPLENRRGPLPDPEPPGEATRISGILSDPPRVGLELGRTGPLDPERWPNLITYHDQERLEEVFGPDLSGAVILLDPRHPAHTTGDAWQPVIMGPERHRAYAFQWAAIALAVFVLWLVLLIRLVIGPQRSSS